MTKKVTFDKLGKIQLRRLREDVRLGSVFVSDYENRYGLDPDMVCTFFDGFCDYIQELMEEDGFIFTTHNDFYDTFDKYDTIENLYDWYCCIEWGC